MVIYNILNKLFFSADTTNTISISPKNWVSRLFMKFLSGTLVNDSGRVIMQVFFYGEKIGPGNIPWFC